MTIGPEMIARLPRITRLDRVVIHHSATARDVTMESITRAHLARPGYIAIGYHVVILGDGTLAAGRPLPLEGAHAPPWNRTSIGLCITGDNTRAGHAWSATQLGAARRWLAALELVLGRPVSVYGHRDVGHPTACPGVDRAALHALLERDLG